MTKRGAGDGPAGSSRTATLAVYVRVSEGSLPAAAQRQLQLPMWPLSAPSARVVEAASTRPDDVGFISHVDTTKGGKKRQRYYY